MCGIVGAVGKRGVSLAAAIASTSHRGPDDTGHWESPDCVAALGFNRLSIIDLSTAGHQPMVGLERYHLVFNGEIYNFTELKAQVPDYPYQSRSDSEVIIAAYAKWGEACLDRFIGMFSFAIWDSETQSLFAARDRFGVKPFYYAADQSRGLVFASEIRALHAVGVPREPDEESWASYLVYALYDHDRRTFWRGVNSLQAGHCLKWTRDGLTIRRWYDLADRTVGDYDCRPDAEVADEYLALMEDSIRLRFRSDVPVGMNLSGGLDSSILLALVNRYRGASGTVNSFTFGTGDDRYDELPWVKKMLVGTSHPHHVCTITAAEVPAIAERVQRHQDAPFGGLPTLAYSEVFRRARELGVIVLLDGQGLDEQWAGYDYYSKPDARPAERAMSSGPVQGGSSPSVRPDCLLDDFRRLAVGAPEPARFPDRLRNLQLRDTEITKIPRALRFNDRISMMWGTELREPFLDHRLFELAFRQPRERKIRGNTQKWLLREIAREILPEQIAEAPKRPVQTPQREWLRGELAEWAGSNIESALAGWGRDWLDPESVRSEWKRYLSSSADNSFPYWQWINLGLMTRQQPLSPRPEPPLRTSSTAATVTAVRVRDSRQTCMIGSLPAEFGGEGRGGVAVHTGKIAEALVNAGEPVTVLADDVSPGTPTGQASVAPFRIMSYLPPTKLEVMGQLLKSRRMGHPRGLPAQASLKWQESLWVRAIGNRYRGLIQRLDPGVVHVHGVGLTPLAVHRALARGTSPLVVTVHSLRGHVPDKMFFARSVPSLFVPDALITVSRHLKSEAISYGVDESKIHVLVNGVDRSSFFPVPREEARRKLGISPTAPIVLLVAHLIERKGADIAINAMRTVVQTAPDAKLYLIGAVQDYTGPEWMKRLYTMPRELGIEKNVVFMGDIPGHTDGLLNLWYNAANVTVLPSRAEGMGLVLIESMACGTPAIGARVGGIPDVITDGVNGLLVPPEDPRSLGAGIVEILTNEPLRNRITETGIGYVKREHDWDAIALKTQEVYGEALKRRSRVTYRPATFTVPARGQLCLNLYSDRSFLLPGKPHVPMLSPFWGKVPETPNDPFKGWLDRYTERGTRFLQMTSLPDADLAILPVAWSHVGETTEGRMQANRFAATARAVGKRTVVFFNSDSTEDVSLEDSLVFRTSLYRSRRKPTEFALPAWSEDFVAQNLQGNLVWRSKRHRPTVGFCGFAAPLFRSWVRNFARWGAGVVGLRKGATNPFVSPGHAIRLRAMHALKSAPGVDTSFVVRDAFFGTAVGNDTDSTRMKQLRWEYFRNIIDTDYTLCVRGAGNFSYRLYETLSCGRIPVFVDTDCVLPYDSVVDWKNYCVYIDEGEIDQIGEKVADFHASLSPADFEDLQRSCRKFWEDYISPEGFFRNFYRHLG